MQSSGEGEQPIFYAANEIVRPPLIKAIARCCGVDERAIGHAGRKDRHALTSQWLSISGGDVTNLNNVFRELPPDAEMEILTQTRHGNKLRPGHLRGNRFILRLEQIENFAHYRNIFSTHLSRASLTSTAISATAKTDYNLSLAKEIIAGSKRLRRRDKRLRYAADAAQAAIFDAVVGERHHAGQLKERWPAMSASCPMVPVLSPVKMTSYPSMSVCTWAN